MRKMLRIISLPLLAFLIGFSGNTFANSQHHSGKNTKLAYDGYYGGGWGKRCRWVGGFWRDGYWVPKRRVCMGKRARCRWVGGYWEDGHWHPRRKVCYSRRYW